MKKYILPMGLFCAAAVALAPDCGAVPARQGKIVKIQPDGTELIVEVIGDERNHAVISEDGRLLLADADGAYCYAVEAEDGTMRPSGVVANSVNRRSPAEASFAARLPQADLSRQAAAIRRAPSTPTPAIDSSTFPTTGEVRSLVILVNYSNVKMTTREPLDFFNRWWNEENFSDNGATGSVRDYFVDQSLGKFKPYFDVFGPVTLPQRQVYYGQNTPSNDYRAHEMILHACEMLDEEIDFRNYDTDGDGEVDNIYVIYAGMPESNSGGVNTVWPHSADISKIQQADGANVTFDGVKVNHYACSSELIAAHTPDGIGTAVHEFSHVLGLPDLYDTAGAYNNQTPNSWSVLDQGTYLNNARTPIGYGLFERYALGWADPTVIDDAVTLTLDNMTTGDGAIIPTDNPNEYFLLENRQQTGWDSFAPATGMLIWHIDYSKRAWDFNIVNNDFTHQRVDIEEANGDPGTFYLRKLADYTFPGTSKNTSFTAKTTPSMLTWDGTDLDLPITDIAEEDGLVSFKVKGGGNGSAIGSVEGDLPTATVDCSGLTLTVSSPAAVEVTVADPAGRIVATARCNGSTTLTLPAAGIYIVSAGTTTVKVAARL